MNNIRRTFYIASFIMLAGACANSTHPASAGDLRAREAEFFAATALKDADNFAAFFDERALLHAANMPPIFGRSQIESFYRNLFEYLLISDASNEIAEVAASNDLGYTTGRLTNSFAGSGGTVEFTGKYTLVWRRVDGSWQIVVYAISNNATAPSR